ncbi:stage V sporulation protein S [Bacillus daqingensis]|uniref:Stage V sporulation protein S n=1 Tax=Bacillus daqingensis TaxID=872396 RepID=A0ABV9NT67_9BACI
MTIRFYVSTTTKPMGLAKAIQGAMEEEPTVLLEAVGAGAINQALKAVAAVNASIPESNMKYAVLPVMTVTQVNNSEKMRHMMKLTVKAIN